MAADAPAQRAWFQPGLEPRRLVDGYLLPHETLLPGLQSGNPDRQVVLGSQAHILGSVQVAGRFTMARDGRIDGSLQAGADIVLGGHCQVKGAVQGGGRVVLQATRVDGPVTARGDVLLLGACRVGDVRAGGDILVAGTPKTGKLEPTGRVTARPW